MTTEQAPATGEDTPAAPGQSVIRAAFAEDATGIAEAHVASWQTAYRALLPRLVRTATTFDQTRDVRLMSRTDVGQRRPAC